MTQSEDKKTQRHWEIVFKRAEQSSLYSKWFKRLWLKPRGACRVQCHTEKSFFWGGPNCHRKFVPPTLSSWLLLTSCSRRAVSSFFIKALSSSTVVRLCTKLLISCCCLVTFCGRQRDRRRDRKWCRQKERKTDKERHRLHHAFKSWKLDCVLSRVCITKN